MNGVTGWAKSEVLKEILPILTSYGVTYFQWEGLTVSFTAKTAAAPLAVPALDPVAVAAPAVVPAVAKK